MRTGGNFHADLEKDLTNARFASLFKKEKARLKLAEHLHDSMHKAKLSVRKLAARMGTSKSQVERMINDPHANLGVDTLIKFASAIGGRLKIEIK